MSPPLVIEYPWMIFLSFQNNGGINWLGFISSEIVASNISEVNNWTYQKYYIL